MRLNEIGAKNDMPLGWRLEAPPNKVIYEMWRGMLRRCYSDYKYWNDCTVCREFHLLSNFVKWIESEPNYPLLVEDPGYHKWTIDKDGIIPGNKEYAPGKIRLITNSDNVRERNQRMGVPSKKLKSLVGISKKGDTILYYRSCKEASDDGFTFASGVEKGYYKYCKGYKWFYSNDLLGVLNYIYTLKKEDLK